jgi:hypothetical protein
MHYAGHRVSLSACFKSGIARRILMEFAIRDSYKTLEGIFDVRKEPYCNKGTLRK